MKYILFLIVFYCSANLYPLPSGPTVVAGSATFNFTADSLTINVNGPSDRTIIDWDDFSSNAGESIIINQPSGTSAILNRVKSSGIESTLLGSIKSNGEVFIANFQGITLGDTANVKAHGFLVSTLDISNADFAAGSVMIFTGGSTATVVNKGSISGKSYALLFGFELVNEGEIISQTGQAGIGAGKTISFDSLSNDFQIISSLDPPSLITGITHTNFISAPHINIKADGNLYEQAIDVTGTLSAQQEQLLTGKVTLIAAGGSTIVKDFATLSAKNNDGTGGEIVISSSDVQLIDNATILTATEKGGGTIFVGGGINGLDPNIPNADTVLIGANARIFAQAKIAGNGGQVYIFSLISSDFLGTISTRGGIVSGAGGPVDIIKNVNVTSGTIISKGTRSGSDGVVTRTP